MLVVADPTNADALEAMRAIDRKTTARMKEIVAQLGLSAAAFAAAAAICGGSCNWQHGCEQLL